jgi:glutamate synthase (NADPH/NADH) large chain/glutamate synthase (ferredoxin)
MSLNHAIQDVVAGQSLLYRPDMEHDACGVGMVANIHGTRSHEILKIALTSVCNLNHRGALDADAKTGDGAGVLTQVPHRFFTRILKEMGHNLYHPGDLGVGMVFFPAHDPYDREHCRQIIEQVIAKRGLHLFGWRKVPVRADVLGDKALDTCPEIEQVLIGRPANLRLTGDQYERLLFLCRNEIEDRALADQIKDFYIPSFSSRTIVYKGLLSSPQLPNFYPDLKETDYETAVAVFHQRYSTNTFPTWPLAHPFRMLAHNGEINTVRGNRNWMAAREFELEADFWGDDIKHLRPIIQDGGSDSASLDNALEVLAMSGRDIAHSTTMLVPPAWENEQSLAQDIRDFYAFHACMNEPWDGPAALVFCDGVTAGASLDRNGLRPARYKLRSDGLFILASEVGTSALPDETVIEKGRLAPGEMLAIDLVNGGLLRDAELKARLARRQPYGKWITENQIDLSPVAPSAGIEPCDPLTLTQLQLAHGYNEEELKLILQPMGQTGEEAIGSMGDDAPLAVLSRRPRLLYTYFKQLFAQVTNPPIDPIREKNVMSLVTYLGRRHNWLAESPQHALLVRTATPLLTNGELAEIQSLKEPAFNSLTLPCLFAAASGRDGLRPAVQDLCRRAEAAVDAGAAILVLSDRGVDEKHAPIPMLLALGAVHHHLIRAGKRMRTSLVCETAEARDVHQFACLIGYGASSINPYLALNTLRELHEKDQFKGIPFDKVLANYSSALQKGLLKILSKMGISTISSYRGAQIFEAIGVGDQLVTQCFTGTVTQIGGVDFEHVADDTLARHAQAFGPDAKLTDAGFYRNRQGGEVHAYTAPVIQNFHTYVGIKGADKAGKAEDYKKYVESVLASSPIAIRHMLEFVDTKPVPIDEVEPIEDIRRRFTTAGMSLGALSPEAHEALAIAMNRIGGKSNSGEGGEDSERFGVRENGDSANSAIKQVASGRFGVTAEYLASAKEIEIKMAQGSKPGEGGQLPGHKVSPIIARLRHSVPGVTLISPPPHHDIYSIEDLAQLIYDLKKVNPRAKVCVKLVAESGVGTIAAGVAKAHADIVLVSGHDGGTGASPLSSVKFAGGPWELGIAETQQVLLLNGLRDRVTLRTDGGMRTGYDIVVAAILGAEEFNFGTAALIALGCVYVRQCHLNTCPVGVATQDERLRAKFKGGADNVVTFFNGVAQEVRELLAQLGVRSINELIGRTDLVRQRKVGHAKIDSIDLSRLLAVPKVSEDTPRYHTWERNDKVEDRPIDDVILQDCADTLRTKRRIKRSYEVRNINRNVGTKLSGEIAFRYGNAGLPPETIQLALTGTAGQSLGAFLVQGVHLTLKGEANDYVGKGMNGGTLIVRPPAERKFEPAENSIIGNTCIYGATGGRLFANGRAGERFAVRNSGATAVVEGVGDHGCEYMTNGTILVLGRTGKNFGAGMSGGIAYVLDTVGDFESRYNPGMVGLRRLTPEDSARVKELIYAHIEATESERGKTILADWSAHEGKFWAVVPHPPVEAKPATAPAASPAKT